MHSIRLVGLAALISLVGSFEAASQPVTMVVGYTPGGAYDIYTRAFARHVGKHLPGNPTVVVQNMAGAGSMRSANFLYNSAPKDGNTFGMFARGLAMLPLLDNRGIQFDAQKFSWIGSVTTEVAITLAWGKRPFKSIVDIQKNEMVVGATGTGADSVIFPYIMNGVLGTKFRVIIGYPGANDSLLAMERGEVDGLGSTSWSTVASGRPDWIREKKITIIVQNSLKKHPSLPDVPLIMDYAKTDSDRAVLELIFGRQQMAFPIAAPPGVPAERLAVLRRAFEATMKDPEYIAEARKLNLDVDPASGAEIDALLKRIYASPQAVIQRARKAIDDGKNITSEKK